MCLSEVGGYGEGMLIFGSCFVQFWGVFLTEYLILEIW